MDSSCPAHACLSPAPATLSHFFSPPASIARLASLPPLPPGPHVLLPSFPHCPLGPHCPPVHLALVALPPSCRTPPPLHCACSPHCPNPGYHHPLHRAHVRFRCPCPGHHHLVHCTQAYLHCPIQDTTALCIARMLASNTSLKELGLSKHKLVDRWGGAGFERHTARVRLGWGALNCYSLPASTPIECVWHQGGYRCPRLTCVYTNFLPAGTGLTFARMPQAPYPSPPPCCLPFINFSIFAPSQTQAPPQPDSPCNLHRGAFLPC